MGRNKTLNNSKIVCQSRAESRVGSSETEREDCERLGFWGDKGPRKILLHVMNAFKDMGPRGASTGSSQENTRKGCDCSELGRLPSEETRRMCASQGQVEIGP